MSQSRRWRAGRGELVAAGLVAQEKVIHRSFHIGDNYTGVIAPFMRAVQRQRVVIRKPMKAIPKPTRMFHEPRAGTGSVPWLT